MASRDDRIRFSRNTAVRSSIALFEKKIKEQWQNNRDKKNRSSEGKQDQFENVVEHDETDSGISSFRSSRSKESEILEEQAESASRSIKLSSDEFCGKRTNIKYKKNELQEENTTLKNPIFQDFPGKRSSIVVPNDKESTQSQQRELFLDIPKKSASKIPEDLLGRNQEAAERSTHLENYKYKERMLDQNRVDPKKSISNKNEEISVHSFGSNLFSNPHFKETETFKNDVFDDDDASDGTHLHVVKRKVKAFEDSKDEKQKPTNKRKESRKMPARSFHNSLSRDKFQNSRIYRKRSGIANRGKEYEMFTTCHYALHLAIDKTILDFQMSSDNAKFGIFNNLVLEVQITPKITEKFAFQFKHVLGPVPITFELNQEEFSLQKCFEGYKEMERKDCNLVFLTNNRVVQEEEFGIDVNGENLQLRVLPTTLPLVLEKCGLEDCCYKFEIVKEKTTVSTLEMFLEYTNFLEKFYLCCNQKNLEVLKKSLPQEFKDTFDCDVEAADKYIQFIFQWNSFEGMKEKVSKSLIQQVVTLHVLDPLIKTISFSSRNDNAKILQKTIAKFDVTVLDKDSTKEATQIFEDAKTKLASEDVVDVNKRYQITSDNIDGVEALNDEECTRMLWAMGKCPLIVDEHPSIYKAMELLKVGKFILLGQNNLPPKCSVFQKLSDLNHHEDLYDKIIDNFCCFLAGEEVFLRELISDDASFEDIITTNELVKMLSESYKLPVEKMELPKPYIYRRVSRNIIDFKFLERVDKDTFVLVSNATQRKDVEKHAKQGCCTSLDQKGGHFNVWIVEKECTQEDFDKLCRENPSKRFHHLGMVGGQLEWYKSVGDLSDLEPHRIGGQVQDIREINLKNNINIIVDQAGIGKSVLLKELKNRFDENFWTVFLTSTEISAFCQIQSNSFSTFEKFLFETKYSSIKGFDRRLLKRLLASGKVMYIWDGLDEISANNFDFISVFIRSLPKNKSVHFLACRPYLKTKIEEKFSVMSRIVDPFDENDIDFFIEEILRKSFPLKHEQAKQDLKKIMSDVQLGDFLKVPIQLFMLTELFVQNFQKSDTVLNGLFSVTDLYKYFVEKKLKQSHKRLNVTFDNDYSFQKEQIRNYQEAALITMFNEDVLKKLNVDSKKFHERNQERIDVFGFFTCTDGQPQFYHFAYADYFVATYFAEHHAQISDLKNILFDTQYTNVRLFFDILLAEKSIPHLAVLYKNIEVLRKCQKLDVVDNGGRNVLQLICSWGERYTMLKVKEVGNVYELDDTGSFGVKEESVQYKDILELLLQELDINKKDKIFGMDAFEYARANKSIFAILYMVQKHNTDYLKSKSKTVLYNCLYYAAQFGFDSILRDHHPRRVVRTKSGHNLLHIAIEHSQIKCVETLLSQEKYKKCLNQKGHAGETPLHLSAKTGDYKVVDILLTKGGDITAVNESHQTPLFSAAQNGRSHVVKHLITFAGAQVDHVDKFGRTALSYACENGHANVVEVLKNKADFKVFDKNGWTPLFYAAKNGRENIVELLLQCDIDVNAFNKIGKSALLLAVENRHLGVVELLVKNRANINLPDMVIRWTPLFYAVKNGHEEMVKFLLESGGDANVKDNSGKEPIQYASRHKGIIKLLEKKMR